MEKGTIEFVEWMDTPMFKIGNLGEWITRCVLQQPACISYKVFDEDGNLRRFDGQDELNVEELFSLFKQDKGI